MNHRVVNYRAAWLWIVGMFLISTFVGAQVAPPTSQGTWSPSESASRIVSGPEFSSVGEDQTIWIQTNGFTQFRFSLEFGAGAGGSGHRLGRCQWSVDISKQQVTEPLVFDVHDKFSLLAESAKRIHLDIIQIDSHRNSVALRIGPVSAIRQLGDVDLWISSPNRDGDLVWMLPLPIPATAGSRGKHKIAFGSCSHQERYASQRIWDVLVKEKPDCFLFIGDNIYLPNSAKDFPAKRADVLKLYCDAYDRERRNPQLREFLKSTICYATWDDHDYGDNNSDRTWPWKGVAREAFKLYFPGEYGTPDAKGCFQKFAWGDIDVFMLDDRTFRDPNLDPKRKTLLGEKQLAWLKEGIAASKATFKLIVCGNQMLADAHPFESWGVQYRAERDAFLAWLWDRNTTGVIFLSGDRHFAELTRKKDPAGKGATYWDLTSSPLANLPYLAGAIEKNPDRWAEYARGSNAGIVEFDTTAKPPTARMRVVTDEGDTVIDATITPQGDVVSGSKKVKKKSLTTSRAALPSTVP